MALSDFEPAGAEPEPRAPLPGAATGSAQDADAAGEAEDEDLFEFPEVRAVFDPAARAAGAARADTAGELLALEANAPPDAKAPTAAPAPQAAAAPEGPDPLDEDIFDFAALSAHHDLRGDEVGDVLRELERAADDDLEDTLAELHGLEDRQTARKVERHEDEDDDEPAAPERRAAPGHAERAPAVAVAAAPARGMTLALACVVVLNACLVALAWKTSRSFRTGVDDLARTALALREAEARPAQPLGAEPAPEPAAGAPAAGPRDQQPAAPFEPFDATALALAQEELDEGEYAAARLRLHRLLAVLDRVDAERRQQVEALARFAIADSYRLQAERATPREGGP